MDGIMKHIIDTYDPISVIVYGSYADGTNNLNSDFDALVISRNHPQFHDTTLVEGIPLDVFVYPQTHFSGDFDPDEILPIIDGKIVLDSDNKGASLKAQVLTYFRTQKAKSDEDIRASLDWCEKMYARCLRGTAESMFRWHWLLADSLEIFCDTVHHPYLGPKKALTWMEHNHPEAFALYQRALFDFSDDSLSNWICYLTKTR